MSKLGWVIQALLVIVISCLLSSGVSRTVYATGCEIVKDCYLDDGVEFCVWYDGCGGNWDYCDPNFYRAPDGSCRENGGGVACGEFYACPMASNPAKMCKNTCGNANEACRAGKTDCPAGSVINLSQVVSTSCYKVNGESQCGGLSYTTPAKNMVAGQVREWRI